MKNQIKTKTLAELEKEIKQLKKPNLIKGGTIRVDSFIYGIGRGIQG